MRNQLLATAITIPVIFVAVVWGVGSALACDSHCQFSRGQIDSGQLMHAQQQEWKMQALEQQRQGSYQPRPTQRTGCYEYRTLFGAVFGAMVNVPKC